MSTQRLNRNVYERDDHGAFLCKPPATPFGPIDANHGLIGGAFAGAIHGQATINK